MSGTTSASALSAKMKKDESFLGKLGGTLVRKKKSKEGRSLFGFYGYNMMKGFLILCLGLLSMTRRSHDALLRYLHLGHHTGAATYYWLKTSLVCLFLIPFSNLWLFALFLIERLHVWLSNACVLMEFPRWNKAAPQTLDDVVNINRPSGVWRECSVIRANVLKRICVFAVY